MSIILILVFLIGRRKYKQLEIQAQLMSTEWMADWDNIQMRQNKEKSSIKSLMSVISEISVKNEKEGNEEKIVCDNQGL